MAATTTPLITVSYGGVKHQMPIGVRPALELNDAEVDEAEEQLRTALRSAFSLPDEARLSVHETESGRSLSKESFRDPANLARFPKYWYLRVDNGYSSSGLLFDSIDREEEGQLEAESAQLRELLMMEKGQPSIGEFDDTDTDSGLFPSLMELSMGGGDDGGSQDSNREDLMTMCMQCDADGDYGLVLRHFTVLAAVPNSENSSDGSGSRCDSRGSARSSESYDTLRMSSLFVHRIVSSLPAEQAGMQLGDIVYSVNGQCVAQSTTEEIKTILTNSGHVLTLCVQPERNDNLLFLYPQYSHGESGMYDKNQGEQIIVEDIEVKAGRGRFRSSGDHDPEMSAVHLHNGESSMDDQWLQHSSVSGSQPPLMHSVGSNSFSPYHNPSFLPDDLLISGSLADIPVEQSPFLTRRQRMNIPGDSDSLKEMERLSSGGEGSLQQLADQEDEEEEDESPSSQEWSLSPQDKENVVLASPEWFPDSNVRHFDDSLSFPGSVHHSVSRDTTELSNKPRDQNSAEPKKFSQRLKDTFLNITGGSNRKMSRPDSASTNALDRLNTSSLTSSLPDRSHSSECMRIKPPKKSRPSLNQLTRVSSADNVFSGESSWLHHDRGGESSQPGSWRYSSEEAQPDIVITEMPSALKSTSSEASPSQFDENGKSLSGEEILPMSPGIKGRQSGRSYSSHRLKLHNSRTSSHSTLSEEEVSSPLSTSARRGDQRPAGRKGSRAYRHNRVGKQLSNETVGSADLSPCQDSSQNNSDVNKGLDGSFESPPTSAYSRYITSHRPLTKSSSLNRSSETTNTTHKQSTTQPTKAPVQKSFSVADKPYKVPIHVPPPFSPNSLAAMGAGAATSRVSVGLASVTSAARAVRPVSSGGERELTTTTSRDRPVMREKPIEARNRVRAVSMQVGVVGDGTENVQKRPVHQNAVFQGHVSKKQMKFANGRKAQDRTWRPLYAAIHGHQLVFYKDFKDAFTGDHLTSEPPINLRQCTAVAFSNSKNRKNKFKLTSSTGAECFIQAEDEEALKKWLQIVHSISYHTRRMTAPILQNLTSSSQVETVSTSKRKDSVEKKRITRVYTPQPRGQRRQDKDDHSQRLFLRFLRKKQSNKEAVDADCTTYLTFGVPLEDCPASYENKRVPLLVAMCVSEIEQHWLETEGIYRMAGPIAQIRTLSNELNKGHLDLLKDHSDAHTITGILKKFLKEIPNPLVPGAQYTNFVAAGKESEEKRHLLLTDLIKTLPPSHYHTLGFLIHHLRKVEVYSSENKMARRNLCMVFGPTLISKPIGEDDGSLVNDMQPTFNVIETFMNHAEEFFPDVLEDLEKSRVNGQSDLSQSAKLRAPYKRGTSGPPDLTGNIRSKRSQGSSSQRKSWDSSQFNRVYSDDQLHADFTNSQDASQPMAHRKTRLSKTLGGLSSQLSVDDDDDEDNVSMKDLVSPLRPKASSPSNLRLQFSSPKPRSNPSTPQRKISYVAAVQNGELVSPQTLAPLDMLAEESLADSVFTHQGLPFTRRQSDPPHQEELIRSYTGRLLYQRQPQSEARLRTRWSTDNTPFPPTEIIGPSSSTANWSNFSSPLQQSNKQESHL